MYINSIFKFCVKNIQFYKNVYSIIPTPYPPTKSINIEYNFDTTHELCVCNGKYLMLDFIIYGDKFIEIDG